MDTNEHSEAELAFEENAAMLEAINVVAAESASILGVVSAAQVPDITVITETKYSICSETT